MISNDCRKGDWIFQVSHGPQIQFSNIWIMTMKEKPPPFLSWLVSFIHDATALVSQFNKNAGNSCLANLETIMHQLDKLKMDRVKPSCWARQPLVLVKNLLGLKPVTTLCFDVELAGSPHLCPVPYLMPHDKDE